MVRPSEEKETSENDAESESMSKILILDIETKPITALVWGLFNQNISLNQIVENGGIICVGMKWLGEHKMHMFSVWEHGFEDMVKAMHSFISEADAIITYNGDKFDIKKIRGACAEIGLKPFPPVASIDVYKTVRTFGLTSGKLAFIGPFFKIGQKVATGGMELWTGVMAGDAKAQKRMEKYCEQDVRLLEKVYVRLLPYIVSHPNIGGGSGSCPRCKSTKRHKRGPRMTAMYRIQRYQCTNCGGWHDGERTKI